jgi:hypothetical protein
MAILAKSTAHNRAFLMVQSADHISALTGATVTANISKNGGAFGAAGGAVTEIANGWYYVALNSTDTGTAGDLAFHCTATSGDPTDFVDQVVDPAVVTLGANVVNIAGDSNAATALKNSTDSICWGTCSGGTTATAVVGTLNNPSSLTDSGQLIGRTIIFLGSTATGNVQAQASNITASTTGSTPTITFTAMTHAPANTDVFVVL